MQEAASMIQRMHNVLDGIVLVGVAHLVLDEATREAAIYVNESWYREYDPVVAAARKRGLAMQVMVGEVPTVVHVIEQKPWQMIHDLSFFALDPSSPSFSMAKLIQTSTEHALHFGWSGYNVDDEAFGSPRTHAKDADLWMMFMNMWADGLHQSALLLTADIQAISWMSIPQSAWALSKVDTWVCMDTYHAGTFEFQHVMREYLQVIPAEKLGIGHFPDGYWTGYEQTASRAEAMDEAGVSSSWIFFLPMRNPNFERVFVQWRCFCNGNLAGDMMHACLMLGRYLDGAADYCMSASYAKKSLAAAVRERRGQVGTSAAAGAMALLLLLFL